MYKYQRLLILSANLPVLLAINIVIAFTLVMTDMYGTVIGQEKLSWLILLISVTAFRYFVHSYFSNDNKHKLDLHFVGVVIAGLTWAFYPYLFHQSMSTKETMLSLIIFCGMSGGSVTLLSCDLRSAIAYVSLTIFPYSVVLIMSGDPSLESLGLMGLLYGVALCITAVKSSRIIFSLIDSQAKVEAIASDLEIDSHNKDQKISMLEQRDMLTGLLNRKSFISAITLIKAKNNQHRSLNGFVHIDIEKLHNVNQNYGHQYGDHIITKVGEVLKNIDKFYDTCSARYGNDEFTVHIKVSTEEEILKFIATIRKQLSVYFQLDNIRVKPDYYFGYYIGNDSISVNQAMRNAYLAVTQGKKSNTRVCCYDTKIQEDQQRNQYLRYHLKAAIGAENFFMNFQPIVRCSNQEVHSFEALVRWELENKNISPAEFISVAEEHGLIVELGQLILKMSIEALADMNKTHPSISISINVSVIQLEDDDFISYLQFIMNKYSVNPANVHLEITETAMISNITKLTNRIIQAKEAGVMISVDDFGTGFSSIAVLRNLKIDYIKIDKSYIDNICSCDKDKSIVSAVTKMAHTIGTNVVAEGIETDDQLALIGQSGIDFYQGYLFSKPVSFKEAIYILEQEKKRKNKEKSFLQ
ncbi:EAL domain-containing protein [Vibrio sp. Y2-5]|uniref:putative bifunctional diguanylate cyclase/phosphodiesterase n=1 Tax=Vibrio sp. Y2-5 TaxID=2743977 RepID=UPI00166174BF|nr:GGDEF domain-containing phosphodiesterase [Vibrio sp. Y2-5]MBD0788364.1 EAL domain-containing protein [Vibrio sp. Y2-5]